MASKLITCVDIEGKTYEVPVNQLIWRPSAYGIVIKKNKVLLSKQFDGYDLPGGGIDLGETPEEATLREVKEETGIDAANPKLISSHTSFFKMPRAKVEFVESIMLYYVCDFVGGEFSTSGFDEHEKKYAEMPEWISKNELTSIKIVSSFNWRSLVMELLK